MAVDRVIGDGIAKSASPDQVAAAVATEVTARLESVYAALQAKAEAKAGEAAAPAHEPVPAAPVAPPLDTAPSRFDETMDTSVLYEQTDAPVPPADIFEYKAPAI